MGAGRCTSVSSLRGIVQALFRGPAPENDLMLISNAFDLDVMDEDASLLFVDYMSKMSSLRDEASRLEQAAKTMKKNTCEYNSMTEFHDSLKRHHRMERSLQQKQIQPLCASQEFGWEKQNLQKPVAGRETSAVAKFAEELIRNGIYY